MRDKRKDGGEEEEGGRLLLNPDTCQDGHSPSPPAFLSPLFCALLFTNPFVLGQTNSWHRLIKARDWQPGPSGAVDKRGQWKQRRGTEQDNRNPDCNSPSCNPPSLIVQVCVCVWIIYMYRECSRISVRGEKPACKESLRTLAEGFNPPFSHITTHSPHLETQLPVLIPQTPSNICPPPHPPPLDFLRLDNLPVCPAIAPNRSHCHTHTHARSAQGLKVKSHQNGD